jgi:hypothetical protein
MCVAGSSSAGRAAKRLPHALHRVRYKNLLVYSHPQTLWQGVFVCVVRDYAPCWPGLRTRGNNRVRKTIQSS